MFYVFTFYVSSHQPELRLLPHPTRDPHVLQARSLQMLEVLLEGGLVELRQKLGLNRDVEAANVVDELTFVHGGNTFRKSQHPKKPAPTHLKLVTAGAPAKIGQLSAPT